MSERTGSGSGPAGPHMALIRAIRDWSLEQGFTPQVLVDVTVPGVEVPMDHARAGQIVLNVHPNAVRDLETDNGFLLFSARFSGRPENIVIPVEAVLAVYARENGQGIVLQAVGSASAPGSSTAPDRPDKAGTDPPSRSSPGPRLRVIK